ncbi:hypothetical protein FKP32DRAFT_1586797 [Trametes sanguinea]|nr:hypothetical protein FKP32DRAFT_1586797 [Trametes sanguinea]
MQPSNSNPLSTTRIAYQRSNGGNHEGTQDFPVARADERIQGTYYFIALSLLKTRKTLLHRPYHDIESAYWVLVWAVLRHTDCRQEEGKAGADLCKRLFSASEDDDAHAKKLAWLQEEQSLVVSGNEPLTTLINRLNDLVCLGQTYRFQPVPKVELTHHAFLTAFDEALATKDWPANDRKPCALLQEPRTGIAPAPILHDIVPGYPIHSEGRALRSNTHSNAKPAPALPTVPVASGSGSLAPVQRSAGTKRANADDASAEPSGAKHSRKRSKANNMAPPPAPGSGEAAAGPSEAKTSGGRVRRSGSRAAPALTRQPTRRSSRIEAQKERNASRSDPAR